MSDGYRGASPGVQPSMATKAQQFEDEKKRITQSCFHKQDTDGSLLESYITHCRVLEDAQWPSTPPDLAISSEERKKPRLIFLAVRKSGRVRMHKARENANGSFSIGKTWNLDDLQAITNHGQPHEKGFTVTILKDYYWQANSIKEKEFFINSMLRIYKKYTGGKIPELIGFKRAELEHFLGHGGAQLVEAQRQEKEAIRSKASANISRETSVCSSSNAPSQTQPSVPQTRDQPSRSISSTNSGDSGWGPPRGPAPRPPNVSAAPLKPQQPASEVIPGPLRPARSLDRMGGTGTPDNAPPRPLPPALAPGFAVPAKPSGPPNYPAPRPRPSQESTRTASSINSREGSRAHPSVEGDRERDIIRRQPSTEQYRAPSVNSQHSNDSRREAMDQYPLPLRAAAKEQPPSQVPSEDQAPRSKKSGREVASHFRLAANAYGATGVIAGAAGSMALPSPKGRPKTPTTPNSVTPLSAGPRTPSEQMPHINYPQDGRGASASPYGRRPSVEDRRRPSGDSGRMENLSKDDPRRPRSLSRTSRDLPPPSLSVDVIPPLPINLDSSPKEPPRNDARGRPTLSRENSIPKAPPPMQRVPSKGEPHQIIPTVNEPLAQKEQRSVPKAASSAPSALKLDPDLEVKPPLNRSQSIEHETRALNPSQESQLRSRSPGEKIRDKKRRSNKTSLFLDGLDKSKMTVDIEELLQEFSWDGQKRVEKLQTDVKKELSRVESSNVVTNIDDDDRVEQLSELLDSAIKECEEMDGLLTLYAVELTSLNDDIFHIENQSQGLQVQTANQKTLQKELEDLLRTISISQQQMDVLKGSLESSRGLEQIEQTLLALYKAMKTMEPENSLGASSPRMGKRGSFSEEGVGSMRALQERKDEYRSSCQAFLSRMHQFMHIKFQAEFLDIAKQPKDGGAPLRPRLLGHDHAYQNLWRYAGLVSFARDVDGDEYAEVQKLYERPVQKLFQEEFRDHILAWKKITKKPAESDLEMVFTAPEKEIEHTAVSAARKLTVKKSIARIRGDSFTSKERPQAGIFSAHEAFSGAFNEIYQVVFREQNFIVEFFHLSSNSAVDFIEFVQGGANSPETRRLGDLGGMHAIESDKVKAKLVFDFMGEILQPLAQELQNLVEWATSQDATQGVGIMYTLEQKIANLDETNQEFLAKTLSKLHERLAAIFARFLDEQVRAIEDTKVKIKKRKGVIMFMRVFPGFTAKIEEQLPYGSTSSASSSESSNLDTREMVNEGYEKINKAMFESLQAIAKDSPAVAAHSVDPEDKEQLNYHIMMIENMHHYLEEVDIKGNEVLEQFKKRAEQEYKEHMELYIGAVIRRPVGKLLDFVEGVETLQKQDATDIPSKPSHSKHIFKKVLSNNDGKEVRKGIEQLKKRVDKHFGESAHHDDVPLSQKLVEKILTRLEDEYVQLHKRIHLLLVTTYKEMGLECEFMVQDVRLAFKK